MLFETGIPPEYKTLVVVPMMLLTPESIREEINRLEIRYLANTDPLLSFGLFSDFSDAKEQHAETDASLLKIAMEGLQALEHKYGEGKFFLFIDSAFGLKAKMLGLDGNESGENLNI